MRPAQVARARRLLSLVKPLLSHTVYRPGSVRTILLGPGRGLRYRIFRDWGLAPIYGGWEPEAQELMCQHIRPGDIVYDLGANRGMHTLLFARLAGPNGHVYAFEPVDAFLQELHRNVRLNGFHNVTAVPLAASDTEGTAVFFRGHHEGAGHLAESGDQVGDQLEVRTVTLSDFVLRDGNRPPTFIKLDIEGAEGSALRGAQAVLANYKPTVLVDLHTPDQDCQVGNILADFGYVAYRTGRMVKKIVDLRRGWPDPEGIWGQVIAFPGP